MGVLNTSDQVDAGVAFVGTMLDCETEDLAGRGSFNGYFVRQGVQLAKVSQRYDGTDGNPTPSELNLDAVMAQLTTPSNTDLSLRELVYENAAQLYTGAQDLKRRWPTSCSERTCTMQSNSNRGRNCCTATQRETRAAWLFLLPSLTGVVLFVLLPFAETVRRSLFDTMGTVWVGLSNYRSVIQKRCLPIGRTQYGALFGDLPADSSFRQPGTGARAPQPSAAANTGCPHLQNHLLLPIAIPVASIVLLWQTLFARQGLCNGWLTCLGVQPIDFMGTGTAFWVLTGTYLWKKIAGIQAFFGRPGWKRFRSISMKQPASMVQGHGSSSGISPGLSSRQL